MEGCVMPFGGSTSSPQAKLRAFGEMGVKRVCPLNTRKDAKVKRMEGCEMPFGKLRVCAALRRDAEKERKVFSR